MPKAKCLTPEDLLAEIRAQAEIESAKSGKLVQRWIAQLFYITACELFSAGTKDAELNGRLMELFYWSDELRHDIETVDNVEVLNKTLLDVMAPFQAQFWMFREAWRSIEFRQEFHKSLWYPQVNKYLETKGLSGAPYFLRVASDDPQFWVYTENEEHGKADRQVKTKLGKLLAKLLPHETATEIQRVATHFQNAGKTPLHFTKTEEDCVNVYKNGPATCMSHSPAVKAFASEDLSIAYIVNDAGKPTARTICNMVKKQYTRIHPCYGMSEPLKLALEADGFTEGDLDGCRMNLVWQDGSLLFPNMDYGNKKPAGSEGAYLSYMKGNWDKDTETLTLKWNGNVTGGCGTYRPERNKVAA